MMTARMVRGWSRWHTPMLWLVLALGLALRVHRLGAPSLWIDELNSLYASTGRSVPAAVPAVAGSMASAAAVLTSLEGAPSWRQIWAADLGARHGNPHPPLYALALRLWRELFGDGEAALRSLSVLWSMVALVLLYDMSRRLHGAGVALLATLLMALAPVHVRYAQEARGYAMGLALALAAGDMIVRIQTLGARPRRTVALWLCSLAAALCHYFSIGVLCGLGLYAALRLAPSARRQVLGALALAGLVFVVAWGPFFWSAHVTSFEGFPGFREPRSGHLARTLFRLADVPIVHLTTAAVQKARPSPFALVVAPVLLILALRPSLRIWLFWAAGALGMVAAHDLLNSTRQLAVIRFTLFACPATYVVLATSIAWRSWRRWLLPAAAVTASLCSLPEAYKVDKPAWRELGETLRLVAGQGDAVLLSHANRAYLLRAIDYYTDLRNQYVVTVRPEPSLAVRAAVDAAPRAWLVGTSPEDLARFPAWRIAAVVFEGTTPLPTLWSLEKRMGSPAVAKRPARLRPYWPPRPP